MPKRKKVAQRQVRPVLHIFCEGEKTEPLYIRRYLDANCMAYRRLCDLQVCRDLYLKMEDTVKNTPVQLVDVAVDLQGRCPDVDVFWVVYDRESVAKYSDKLHQQAQDKAASHGIHVALTNVCFEVWLLLHKAYSTKAFNSYDDLYANSPLKRHFPNYAKGDASTFSVTDKEIAEARRRAKKLNAASIAGSGLATPRPYQLNPYTDMHLLLDGIDRFLAAEVSYRESLSRK